MSVVCLSDISLSRTSGLSRTHGEQRPKIGAEVAHVTRNSDTNFKVKRCRDQRYTERGQLAGGGGILWRPPAKLVQLSCDSRCCRCTQLVGSSLAPTCKCHGVSGSCSIKTCWKALPDVRQFGLALQKRYATALEIRARRDRRSRERRLVAVQRSRRSVAEDELVYYTISPDYCLPDNSLGSVGTRGRYDQRLCTGNRRTSGLHKRRTAYGS